MDQGTDKLLEVLRRYEASLVILHGEKRLLSSGKLKSASLAVVVPNGCDKALLLRKLYLALPLDFPVSLNLYTEQEWNMLIADPCSHASWIAEKGTVLYGES